MKRFDVLDPKTPILGRRFLEASAGTGKTFSIEHLYTRLLIEGDNPLAIGQILVVTFTRAAARDLKKRIRANLEKSLIQLQISDSSCCFGILDANVIGYLEAIKEKGEKSRKKAIRFLEDAIACFDEAQIFTIHGFCHRMLKEFAFEAHVSLCVSDPDAFEYKAILRQVIKDFLRCDLLPHIYSPRQIAAVLKKYHTSDHLTEKLISLVEKSKEIAAFPSFDEQFQKFQREIEKIRADYPIQKELFIEDFKVLGSRFKQMTLERWKRQVHQFAEILEKNEITLGDWDALLRDEEWFLEGICEENRKKTAASQREHLSYPGLFERLRASLLPLLHEGIDPAKILLKMARDCSLKWIRNPLSQETLSPDAILLKMLACLNSASFVQKIQERYSAAIIDEFQDTDSIQWEIFKHLFVEKCKAVYLVGDPKQSIYAFRDADIYTYLKAVDILGIENKAILDTNFRSDPALVNSLNAFFSIRPDWMKLPELKKALPVYSVKASPQGKDYPFEDGKGALHFFIAEGFYSKRGKWPTSEMEDEAFFPFIASEIQRLKSEHSFKNQSFAILVKDKFQAERIQDYLKKRGISSSVKKSIHLLDTLAFYLFSLFVEALSDPEDLGKIKKVLGGAWIAWTHEKLKGSLCNSQIATAKARWIALSETMQKRGFSQVWQEFLETRWEEGGSSILERLICQEDLSLYLDLRQLVQCILDENPNPSVEELLQWVKEVKRNEEEERFKIFREDGEDRVSILTTHMSKGLEWDIVFAIGIASRHLSSEEFLTIEKNGMRKIELFDLQNEGCLRDIVEKDAEKMRQLYVALTRAKKRVYVSLAVDLEKKAVDFGHGSPLDFFFAHVFFSENPDANLSRISLDLLQGVLNQLREKCSLSFEILKEKTPFLKIPEKKQEVSLEFTVSPTLDQPSEWIYSFSGFAKNLSPKIIERLPQENGEKNPFSLPTGPETGILVHEIIEEMVSLHLFSPYEPLKIQKIIEKRIAGSSLENWGLVLQKMIEDAFHLTLDIDGERFCLKEISPDAMQSEMEFLFSGTDSFFKGFIDLIFEKNGKYYLLDWKTNYLGSEKEDYSSSALENCMKEQQYFLQGAIYAEALKKYMKIFDEKSFESCFGGAIYFFLRGCRAYHFFPNSLTDFLK